MTPVTLAPNWYWANGMPSGDWKNQVPASAAIVHLDGVTDLDTLNGKVSPLGAEGVLYNRFTAAKDGVAQLGFGGDWWLEAFCNGTLCASTFPEGNGPNLYAADNHPVKDWTTVWDQEHGRIMRRVWHTVRLTGLEPGAEYEYRVVLIDPRAPEKRNRVENAATFTFRTLPKSPETCSFFFTADLQFAPARQRQILQGLLQAAGAKDCDFLVFGGDTGSEFPSFEKSMVAPVIDDTAKRLPHQPLLVLRGNHELRGDDAQNFGAYFGTADGTAYRLFRVGDTAFLVLDCWEDKPAETPKAAICKYNLDAIAYAEQAAWLKTTLASEVWKAAQRHIVFCHGAPDRLVVVRAFASLHAQHSGHRHVGRAVRPAAAGPRWQELYLSGADGGRTGNGAPSRSVGIPSGHHAGSHHRTGLCARRPMLRSGGISSRRHVPRTERVTAIQAARTTVNGADARMKGGILLKKPPTAYSWRNYPRLPRKKIACPVRAAHARLPFLRRWFTSSRRASRCANWKSWRCGRMSWNPCAWPIWRGCTRRKPRRAWASRGPRSPG